MNVERIKVVFDLAFRPLFVLRYVSNNLSSEHSDSLSKYRYHFLIIPVFNGS